MKKFILIAGILTVGIMSANTFSVKNEKVISTKIEKLTTSKSLEKDNKLQISYLKAFYPIYYTTSCGVAATTNQSNWTEAQMMAWADALESNYCN